MHHLYLSLIIHVWRPKPFLICECIYSNHVEIKHYQKREKPAVVQVETGLKCCFIHSKPLLLLGDK